MKKCSKCKELKPLTEFRFRNTAKGIKHSKCNICFSAYQKYRWDNNINGARDNGRMASKRYNYKNRYNLTDEKVESLLKDSNGKCEICNTETKLFVDHCHKKQSYRGLLCRSCNLMLGYAKDNVETLLAGAKYIQSSIQLIKI